MSKKLVVAYSQYVGMWWTGVKITGKHSYHIDHVNYYPTSEQAYADMRMRLYTGQDTYLGSLGSIIESCI